MSKKGWNGESQRHSLAKRGVRTNTKMKKINITNIAMVEQIFKKLNIHSDMNYDVNEDIQVEYTWDEKGNVIGQFVITIKNPLIVKFDDDNFTEKQLKEAQLFFEKHYPYMNFDNSHLKYEDYISFYAGFDIPKSEIKKAYKYINNEEKLIKWYENIHEKVFWDSKINEFRNDWALYYRGIEKFKEEVN